jgi:hypothetical protein
MKFQALMRQCQLEKEWHNETINNERRKKKLWAKEKEKVTSYN